MAEAPYAVKRANPRSRFSQMPKLPFATERGFAGSLRIELAWLLYRCARTHSHSYELRSASAMHDTCELHGKVIYMHSGGGFGISAWACCLKRWVPSSTRDRRMAA